MFDFLVFFVSLPVYGFKVTLALEFRSCNNSMHLHSKHIDVPVKSRSNILYLKLYLKKKKIALKYKLSSNGHNASIA